MLPSMSDVCLDTGVGDIVYLLTHVTPLYSSYYVLNALHTLTHMILSMTMLNILQMRKPRHSGVK